MTSTPHDALVRGTLSDPDHARAFLAAVVPAALRDAIEWSTLRLAPGSFVDERLARRETDLLFEVRCRGAPLLVYVLFEHLSTVEPLAAFRMLRYMVRIWERDGEGVPERRSLRPILPVVLHHSETGWTAATAFDRLVDLGSLAGSGIERHVPRFELLVDDVSHQTDAQIGARVHDATVRLVLAALREGRRTRGDGLVLVERLAGLLREFHLSGSSREALVRVLRYVLLVTTGTEPQRVIAALRSHMDHITEEGFVSLAEALEQQGMEKGIEQGIERGTRDALLRVLARRFGPPPEGLVARVEALGGDDLRAALDRAVTASSLRDVLS